MVSMMMLFVNYNVNVAIEDNIQIYAIKVLQKHNKYFITSKTRNRKTLNK